ncbi:MAG TPA: hypothetical protein VIU11_09315 [Nakamurella sp.]
MPPEYSGFAAEWIPGAELVELASGTHLAFWVHPDSAAVRQRAIDLFRSSAGRPSIQRRGRPRAEITATPTRTAKTRSPRAVRTIRRSIGAAPRQAAE